MLAELNKLIDKFLDFDIILHGSIISEDTDSHAEN
jgi:hypothetical protein